MIFDLTYFDKILPDNCVIHAEIGFNDTIGTDTSAQNIRRRWNVIIITNFIHIFKQAVQKEKQTFINFVLTSFCL